MMKQRLKQALAQRQKTRIVDASWVLSAVLLPVYDKQGEYHILLTKRTETVADHKGEISFPGGACEVQDATRVDTALRECAEEIGLLTEKAEILGELDDTTTTSGYIISPFVAAIPWPYHLKVDRVEVREIIEVPISTLLCKDCLRQETEVVDGRTVTTNSYHYRGHIIWGATARILTQFLDIWAQVVKESEIQPEWI